MILLVALTFIGLPLCLVVTSGRAFWADFGPSFKAARLAAGYSMARLSIDANIDVNTIHRWEHGERRPWYGGLYRACVVLRVPVESLFPPTHWWRE